MSRLRKQTATGNQRRLHRRHWRKPGAKAPSHEELIEAASEDALLKGKNLTAIRKHVLSVLLNAQRPLSAYEVLDSLKGVGSISPPTAYRALEFLIQLGFVQRIDSLNSYMALPHGPSDVPVTLFICDTCGRVKELDCDDAMRSIIGAAKSEGLKVFGVSVELHGDCRGSLGECVAMPAAHKPAISAKTHK